MQVAVDPAQLILAWRPVATDGMNVAVNETRGKDRAFGIDVDRGSGSVDVFFFAHGNNAIVDRDHGVGVEDGIGEIATKQEPDIAYD